MSHKTKEHVERSSVLHGVEAICLQHIATTRSTGAPIWPTGLKIDALHRAPAEASAAGILAPSPKRANIKHAGDAHSSKTKTSKRTPPPPYSR